MSRSPTNGVIVMRAAEQQGVALLTVMLLALILTVLGIAAINVSGWERRIAGLSATAEASASAAESCIGTSVNIIKQVFDINVSTDELPPTALSNAVPPGPVPVANKLILFSEIKGQLLPSNAPSENNPDVPTGPGAAPNIVQNINNFAIAGDIDRLWMKEVSGNGKELNESYVYRIDCVATNVATGTTSRITAVYSCLRGTDGCEAKQFDP